MGKETHIQWTEKTWNPIQGCRKVSAGCKNCYMFSDKRRYGQNPEFVARSSDATFYAPLKWKEPSLIFTCSWSDWFIEEGDAHRAEMWDVIRRTPHHTYQILTKRPERIAEHLPSDWGDGWPNVWLGVSVENQDAADRRIPQLLRVPAKVRFLSCEPLLEAVDLSAFQPFRAYRNDPPKLDDLRGIAAGRIDWVIVGGESGSGARECNLAWIDSLMSQCSEADVPVFVKQLGAKPVYPDSETGQLVQMQIRDRKGADVNDFPCHFHREMPQLLAA